MHRHRCIFIEKKPHHKEINVDISISLVLWIIWLFSYTSHNRRYKSIHNFKQCFQICVNSTLKFVGKKHIQRIWSMVFISRATGEYSACSCWRTSTPHCLWNYFSKAFVPLGLCTSKSFVDSPSDNKANDWVIVKVLQQSFQIFGAILENICLSS